MILNIIITIFGHGKETKSFFESTKYRQYKRKKLILKRLKKLGIELNIELELKKRFKSLAVETKGNEETIYYNDGTECGLRVITFVTKEISLDI